MTCDPELANNSVLPSGAARATCSVAITPPPPPRFSITISVLSRVCMSEATRRASVSTGPPAANGTTTLIASAAFDTPDSESSSASTAPKCRIIASPPKSLFSGRQPNTGATPSPALCGGLAAQHLGDAGARPSRRIRRQRIERKEAVRRNLAVRLGRRDLTEVTHHIDRHVVAL